MSKFTVYALLCLIAPTYGAPSYIVRRDGQSGVPLQTWVPILVVVILLIMVTATCWTRSGLRKWIGDFTRRAAVASGVSPPLELTAEQLAGGAAPRTEVPTAVRNNRRNRRTPSQISTRSLPVYMKEPGDQELVIFRGPDDMEDAGTVIVPMPTMHEANESSQDLTSMLDPSTTHFSSTNVVYTTMPNSPSDMPLLQQEESYPDNARRSIDTMSSSESRSILLTSSSQSSPPDDRGEAPSYNEAMANTVDFIPLASTPSISAPVPALPPGMPIPPPLPSDSIHQPTRSVDSHMSVQHRPSTDQTTNRRSGFMSFFSSRAGQVSPPLPSHSGHGRTASTASDASGTTSDTHARAASRTASRNTHHTTPSGSGSLFSLGRTRSRGTPELLSQSNISVNAISAPLTHTVVRTEFTYPKAGPTPDQLKFISSRDQFVRFGMPYGADAIAYASSRTDLAHPPPAFDDIAQDAADTSTPSGERTVPSDAAADAEPDHAEALAAVSAGTGAPPEDSQMEESTAPSAFRMSSSAPRAESRASSSHESFITADDALSVVIPSTPRASTTNEDVTSPSSTVVPDTSSPTTPRVTSIALTSNAEVPLTHVAAVLHNV